MATKLFLQHRETGSRFEIRQRFEKDGVTYVVLKGETAEFTEVFDRDKFKALGYDLTKADVADSA